MKKLSLYYTSHSSVDIQLRNPKGEIRKHCLYCSTRRRVSHRSYHLRLHRFRRSSFQNSNLEARWGADSPTYSCRTGMSPCHRRLHQFRTCRRNCNSRPRFQHTNDRQTDLHRCRRCSKQCHPGTLPHSKFQLRSLVLSYHTSRSANCNIGSRYRGMWHCCSLGRTAHLHFLMAQ